MVAFFLLASRAEAAGITEYTIRITPQNMATIGHALGQAPYDQVAEIIADLQRQMIEQQKAAAAPPKPDPVPQSGQ
jgi:hypothetical protein